MDPRNRFHTATTFRIVRAEHLLVLVVCSLLAILNWNQINWWHAVLAFALIDVVGYLPGALAFRRQGGQKIHAWYHHAYNIAHTYLVTGAGVAVWAYCIGGLEWAMLAVPIHLSIDRGLFGNTLKPTELSFEPADHTDNEILLALGRIPGADREIIDLDGLDPRFSGQPAAAIIDALEHPSGYLAQSRRNRRFMLADTPGFIAYRSQGQHLWMFGGVHADEQHAPRLLDRFIAFANQRGQRVGAVQVRPHQVELFSHRGFDVNQLGSTYAVTLQSFTTSGSKKMQLRNKINQARKAGCTVVELGREVPRDQSWFDKLDAISKAWISGKGNNEFDFMVGEVGTPEDTRRRIFVVLNGEQQPTAFITYVPVTGGSKPGYLHDLTRRLPDTPSGVMELCNVTAMERFKSEGVTHLHFGFTPFIIDEEPEKPAHRLVHQLILWVRKYGQRLYAADSQVAYKLKWGIDVIEREYLAVRPMSLRMAFDFMQLTRSL